MNSRKIDASEGRLINIIDSVHPLTWRRFQQRFSKTWLNGKMVDFDTSQFPPYVSFRLEVEDHDFMQRLRQLIESYSGRLPWTLSCHNRHPLPGNNWLVSPSRVHEIAAAMNITSTEASNYLAQNEPEFASLAYADLEKLTQYLEDNLSQRTQS